MKIPLFTQEHSLTEEALTACHLCGIEPASLYHK